MLLFVLAFTSFGMAQEPEKNVVYNKKTEVDFETVELEGDFVKPQGSIVVERQRARFNPMIVLRPDFNTEISMSINDIE